jgi:hypothetical protein
VCECLLLLALFFVTPAESNSLPNSAPPQISPATKSRIQATFLKAPLSFEANHGQVDEQVKFIARGAGYQMYLTATEAVMVLRKPEEKQSATSDHSIRDRLTRNPKPETRNFSESIVRMQLVGANPDAKVEGVELLSGKVNYFIGNDPKKWRTNIPTYGKVKYQNVYEGVDLVYYGNQGKLEYDFVVAPGADPKNIQIAFKGVDSLRTDDKGELILQTDSGDLRMHKPFVYQEIAGVRKEIPGEYVLNTKSKIASPKSLSVGFQIAAYDTSKPIVIDPVLSYSTYLGGSGSDEESRVITADAAGNAYFTVSTTSIDFPTLNPFLAFNSGGFDVVVTKLSPSGSLVYSTYLGGSQTDVTGGIALDPGCATNCVVYVTGQTCSTNFPITNSFQVGYAGGCDAFVTKLNDSASALLYSTYLGGSGNEVARTIAVDVSGRAHLTGLTFSSNFPTVNAFQPVNGGQRDAFVAKLSSDGSALIYSSYLGGGVDDEAAGIALDSSGSVYITGGTHSSNFPILNPFQAKFGGVQDAFVTKVNAAGSLVYSTFVGGNSDDRADGIAVDSFGNAYITGQARSTNFPTANALQASNAGDYDNFVTKLSTDGSSLVYSTYLGGSGTESGGDVASIAVDSSGNAYVTGITASTNFPTVNALQPTNGGDFDLFVAQINPGGSALIFSTYLGGSGTERTAGIAMDPPGNVYVVGRTSSSNFPVVNALQSGNAGNFDIFVAKICITNVSPTVGAINVPAALVQVNSAVNADAAFVDPTCVDTHTAVWNWGDGSTSVGTVTETNGSGSVTGSHFYTAAGVYTVTLTVTDDDGGSGQSVFQFVVVYDPDAGFVTGGGWIDSPAGAYAASPSLAGKANFGFVSRYRPGKTVPEGQTEFRFSVANLNFHSSNYDWLVVGGARAQYKGTGTINGSGGYKFILTAIDGQRPGGGGVDKFRIKIWRESDDILVYDNQMGALDTANPTTALGGGSIVIHTN